MKKILIIAMSILFVGQMAAQEKITKESSAEFTGYIELDTNPGKGYFFMSFNLPADAKKTIWTITDENGQVLVKEKYKNLKAGKNKIGYNYKSAPDGMHTFKIVSGNYTISKKIEKKR